MTLLRWSGYIPVDARILFIPNMTAVASRSRVSGYFLSCLNPAFPLVPGPCFLLPPLIKVQEASDPERCWSSD